MARYRWTGRSLAGAMLAVFLFAGPALAAKTKITVWYPWAGFDGELMIEYAKKYSAQNPNVEVEPIIMPGAGVGDGKLQAAIAGGAQPDLVLYWGQDQTAPLAAAGLIQPLDALIARHGLNRQQFFPPAWSAGVYKGRVYAIPEMVNVTLLFYNVDLFQEAGLDASSPPGTIEQLDAANRKVTRVDSQNAITRLGFVPWSWQAPPLFWIWAFGGNAWQEGRPGVDSDPAVRALEWWVSIVNRFGRNELEAFLRGDRQHGGQADYLAGGKLAMRIDGEWMLNGYKRDFPDFRHRVAPPPYPESTGRPQPTYLSGNMWLIPSGAKHADEAFKFVAWFSRPENTGAVADLVHNIAPVRAAALNQELVKDPLFRLAIELAGSPNAVHAPISKYAQDVNNALGTAFGNGRTLREAPRQALEKAQALIEALLREKGAD